MVENPPAHKEISDFKFKLFTRLKIFSDQEEFKLDHPSRLVAVASKYGIIFVGTPRGIQCIRTEDLSPQDERNSNRNVSTYKRREFCLGSSPTHIDVSCDNEYLAITLFAQECAVLQIYSIQSCSSIDVRKVSEVRLSNTPGVNVSDLQWNPGVPNMIAVAMTDGSAAVIEFKGASFNINSIPQNSQASCLCWSPKGKQVVIGAKNGSLTQYKPELKAVKTFPPPQLGPSSLSVISVHWLSSFQFIAVYKNATDPSAKSNVVVVNVPKNAATRYVHYEDLCFESDTSRPEYYFIHQQTWNVLILGTTNSMEASILKMEGDNWVQWLQEEGSRPELPLTEDHKDVFNIGIALDTSSTRPIPIGEKMQLGPMPLLLMYAHNGTLCLFHVINTLPDGSPICQAPLPLQDTSGLHLFKAPEESAQPVSVELKESKPPESKIPTEASSQAQAAPINTGLSQFSQSEPTSAQPSVALASSQPSVALTSSQPSIALASSQPSVALASSQPAQVSSAFAGFTLPFSQPSQQSTGSLVTPTFAQSTFSQIPLARPGFSQPQSFFSPSSIAQPTVGQTGSSPASGQLLIIQPQAQLPKPSFSLSQTSQPQIQQQTQLQQTQLQAQIQANQYQQPVIAAKPPSTTSGSWLPLNFQSPQLQPQPSTLSGQIQPAASKVVGTPSFSIASLQVTAGTTTPTTTSPLQSQDSMLAVTPAQESVSPEVAGELDKTKEMENVIERCQELIAQFTKVMEERQKVIRNIMSRTDQNIQKSTIKDKVICDIEKLRKFEANLKDSNFPDQAKVNALGSSLMEMFGWYEKIKARERMTKSSSYIELMESQDLDPVTKNYLKSIDKHVYYLESQIKQAKVKLGALWDNLETTMDIPVMETIYQSLVAQHNILAAKRALIDSYENKLKKINQNRFQRSNRKKVGNLELSTLADRLLETKLEESDYLKDTSLKEASNNYIVLLNKIGKSKLSEEKVTGLYEWHKNHKVIKTKVSKHTAVVQPSFLKDHTFSVEISPSKQSTPYVAAHGTPKKAIVSVPRKSLFTLTSLDDEANALNTTMDMSKSENNFNAAADKQEPDKSITVSSNSAMNIVSKTGDANLQNNLITSFAKANDGNKITSIKNLSNTTTETSPTSSSLLNNSFLQSALSKPNDSIPTPASFKSIPQVSKTPVTKPENVISTSWGAQAPVFGPSPFFSSISKSPTTSASIFSSTGSTLPQSTIAQNVSFAGFVSSSSNNSGQTASGTSSVLQPKSNFTFASTNAQQPLFSGSPKSNDSVPFTGNDMNSQSTVTTATLTYIPTPLKSTSQTSSTSFGLPVSSVNTVNFGSMILSSVSSSTSPAQGISPPSLNSKPSMSVFAIPASVAPSTNTFSLTSNSSASAVATSSPSSAPVSSSFLALSTTANTPALSTSIFGIAQLTSSSSTPVQPATIVVPPANNTPTSASLKPPSSQPNIGTSTSTTQSTSPVVTSQSHASVQNISPKAAGPNWASLGFGNVITNSLFPTTSGSIFGGSTPSATTAVTLSFASVTTTSTLSFASVTTSSTLSFASVTTSASPLFGAALISNSSSTSAATSAVSSSSFANPSSSTTAATISASSSVPLVSSNTATNSASLPPAVTTSTPTSPVVPSTPSTATATTSSLFSSPASSVTQSTAPAIFGGVATAASTTTTASIFGGVSTTTSIFANSFKSPTTTAQSFFSNTPSFGAVTTSAPIFGNSTTSSSGFGTSPSTPVFGTPKTTASIFGASSTTTPTTSFFGVTTAASPIFGGAPTFGTATTTSSFGSPTQSNSVFGAVNALSSTSFFSPTTTAGQTFGTQGAASIFGGTSSFGSPTTTASSASFFGKAICSPTSTSSNVFGSTGNVFGQATTTTASTIFGGGNSFSQKTPFGQAGNLFGQTTSSGGSFGSSGGSLFGGTASFSSPTNQQSNIFQSGNTGGNIFGSASPGGPFSSPQAGQSTFGAPATFQSPQRPFGGSPGFGSAPSFGSAPTFGGSPSFGSSPNKVFGSQPTGAAPAFGSPTQQSSTTFETLAQQDTLSFGNLAQQQNFPTTSFAGSSFSSWR